MPKANTSDPGYGNWNDLPDIDDTDTSCPNDKAVFAELRDVLKKYNALGRFGITLLHKHFDLNADEILVEMCDKENRQLLTKPVKNTNLDLGQTVETCWRLSDEVSADGKICISKCKKVCFRDEDGVHSKRHWP